MKENQPEMTKKQKKTDWKDKKKKVYYKVQALFDQLEFLLISNSDFHYIFLAGSLFSVINGRLMSDFRPDIIDF